MLSYSYERFLVYNVKWLCNHDGLSLLQKGELAVKQIIGLSEIVLWVADKERALAFYRDLLGLEVISPPTLANVFLKVGEGHEGIPQMIVLVPKSSNVKSLPSGYQLHHLALELPAAAFDIQHAALVSAGFEPRSGKHPLFVSRTMYVDDPDGNEVEFICRSLKDEHAL